MQIVIVVKVNACVQPKVIISCNCGIEPNRVIEYKPIVDEAIKISSHKPQFVIMFNRPPVRHLNSAILLRLLYSYSALVNRRGCREGSAC